MDVFMVVVAVVVVISVDLCSVVFVVAFDFEPNYDPLENLMPF